MRANTSCLLLLLFASAFCAPCPAAAQSTRMLSRALNRYDYSVELTVRGMNKIFALWTKLLDKHRQVSDGPLEKISVRMAPDKKITLEGVTKLQGMAKLVGRRLGFRFVGLLRLRSINEFEFVIDEMQFRDPDNPNIVKQIRMKMVKPIILAALGAYFKGRKLNDYIEIDTNSAFLPMVGIIPSLFGVKRVLRFRLKPAAFPVKVMRNLNAVHGEVTGDRLILQGVLKD